MEWSHYLPLKFGAKFDGKSCVVQEGFSSDTTNYILRAAVMVIKEEDVPTHYVTFIRLDAEKGHGTLYNWLLINESSISLVTENEALFIDPKWKEPHLLIYGSLHYDGFNLNECMTYAKIPPAVFSNCLNLANGEGRSVHVSLDKLPSKGAFVGIDAEFVTMSECGNVRSVGRVSCVNEEGDVIVDDYIQTPLCDTVHDYLTPYSGIQESDLNPLTSTKHL
jgi:hypothetical protein